jgi:hypothetical protein
MYDKSTIKYVEVSYIISFKTGSVSLGGGERG